MAKSINERRKELSDTMKVELRKEFNRLLADDVTIEGVEFIGEVCTAARDEDGIVIHLENGEHEAKFTIRYTRGF